MWKTALACAFALATTGMTLATTPTRANEVALGRSESHGVVITDAQIARFKGALRLTANQQRYWPAIESILRSMRRTAGRSTRAVTVDENGVGRLLEAAMPLFQVLDDGQKQIALQLVHALGLDTVASVQ